MKSTIRSTVVHSSALAAALSVLVLAGCQKDGLENQVLSDGAVRYAIVINQSAGTRAGDNGSVASRPEEQSGLLQTGGMVTLKDRSGSISIPMGSAVTEGICKSSGTVATKGTLVNTDGSDKDLSFFAGLIDEQFTSNAFDGTGTAPLFSQTVNWSNGAWVGTPVAYWPQAMSLTFLAGANLPESETVATVDYAPTGVTLDYKAVPEAASAQKDILLGHYQGNGGNNGTARIQFEHPLTAVRFLRGDIDESLVIKSIAIEGVAASGTATMTPAGDIAWSDVSGYDHSVSQSDASGLGRSDLAGYTAKLIGEPFIIIPQNLAQHNVTVSVVFTDDTVLEATISSGVWEAGKTNTYTLGYSSSDPDLLPGKFSVSATEYVQFSRGNLFCTRSGSEGSYSYTFGFESNQYDFRRRNGVTNDKAVIDGVIKETPPSTAGLFLWDIHHAGDFGAFETSLQSGTCASSDVFNWGDAFGPSSGWKTLTALDWDYLCQHSMKPATVNGVQGLILRPDGYPASSVKDSYGPSTNPTWDEAEAAGLVFLPAACYVTATQANEDYICAYWTANAKTEQEAKYYVYWEGANHWNLVGTMSRAQGAAVRLVQKF